MDYYAGIDVSLKDSRVCVMDAAGKIVREAKVPSEPEALVRVFAERAWPVVRIGLEAGPLSQWRHAGLAAAGHEVGLLETRHVKAALSARTVKTDRTDARGLAPLARLGGFRPVHATSAEARAGRARLAGRKLRPSTRREVELSLRGLLRGFGRKVGEVSRGRLKARVRERIAGPAMLTSVIGARLQARTALGREFPALHRQRRTIARP
jgi:transposase